MTARSIATVSLSGSLDEKLRAVAAAGFDAVEIFENIRIGCYRHTNLVALHHTQMVRSV